MLVLVELVTLIAVVVLTLVGWLPFMGWWWFAAVVVFYCARLVLEYDWRKLRVLDRWRHSGYELRITRQRGITRTEWLGWGQWQPLPLGYGPGVVGANNFADYMANQDELARARQHRAEREEREREPGESA